MHTHTHTQTHTYGPALWVWKELSAPPAPQGGSQSHVLLWGEVEIEAKPLGFRLLLEGGILLDLLG